jgi:hypothetical protein
MHQRIREDFAQVTADHAGELAELRLAVAQLKATNQHRAIDDLTQKVGSLLLTIEDLRAYTMTQTAGTDRRFLELTVKFETLITAFRLFITELPAAHAAEHRPAKT